MAITVGEDTLVTVAEFETYWENTLGAGDFPTADAEVALITAMRSLNQKRYKGLKTDPDQALVAPRSGTVDQDGLAIDKDTVPQFWKDAQMEWAMQILQSTTGDLSILSAFKSAQVGPIRITMDDVPSATEMPDVVRDLLGSVLKITGFQFEIARGG